MLFFVLLRLSFKNYLHVYLFFSIYFGDIQMCSFYLSLFTYVFNRKYDIIIHSIFTYAYIYIYNYLIKKIKKR